jgi:hypothetical protein
MVFTTHCLRADLSYTYLILYLATVKDCLSNLVCFLANNENNLTNTSMFLRDSIVHPYYWEKFFAGITTTLPVTADASY